MTSINIVRNQQKRVVEFTVTGHAKYAKYGEDIVCAGISALTQAALLGLLEHLKIPVNHQVQSGFLKVTLPENHLDARSDAILESMVLGLKQIAQAYKKYVRIQESGR